MSSSRGNQPLPLDALWGRVEAMMKELLQDINKTRGVTKGKYMELMTDVHTYCTAGMQIHASSVRSPSLSFASGANNAGARLQGGDLYERVYNFLTDHLNGIHASATEQEGYDLLAFLDQQWRTFSIGMVPIDRLFNYLNRFYIPRLQEQDKHIGITPNTARQNRAETFTIYNLGLYLWSTRIMNPNNMVSQVTEHIIEYINKKREGEDVNISLLASLCKSFVLLSIDKQNEKSIDLGFYQRNLEKPYIEASQAFYKQKATQLLQTCSIADFMKSVDEKLVEEKELLDQLLHPTSINSAMEIVHRELIKEHSEEIQTEFKALLSNDKTEDLARSYRLLSLVGKDYLAVLYQTLTAHVKEYGISIVHTALDSMTRVEPAGYVDVLLKVYLKYDALVHKEFENDSGFVQFFHRAIAAVINENRLSKAESGNKSSQLIAKYCDGLLIKSNKQPEGETEDCLTHVMSLFRFIEEKDVFLKFYSQCYARRLMFSTSSSMDLETFMVGKLQEVCGNEATVKINRMSKDVQISKTLNESFRRTPEYSELPLSDLSVLVCAISFWPLHPAATDFTFPSVLQKCVTAFSGQYAKGHRGRRLQWLHQHCRAEVKTGYLAKPFMFSVTTHQLGILLLFNDENRISVATVRAVTNLKPQVLNLTLTSLIKARLLDSIDGESGQSVGENDISDETCLVLNKKYTNKRVKISLTNVSTLKAKQDTEMDSETQKEVMDDRRFRLEAAIVQIMKTRQKMTHQELVSATIEKMQRWFKAPVPLIKKTITGLIDKEYLRRDEDTSNLYHYVA